MYYVILILSKVRVYSDRPNSLGLGGNRCHSHAGFKNSFRRRRQSLQNYVYFFWPPMLDEDDLELEDVEDCDEEIEDEPGCYKYYNFNMLYQLIQLTNSINQVVVILAGTKMWLGLRLDGLEVWPQRRIVVNSKHLPWLFVH